MRCLHALIFENCSQVQNNYHNDLLPARISFYLYGGFFMYIATRASSCSLCHELRTFKLNCQLNVDPLVPVQKVVPSEINFNNQS